MNHLTGMKITIEVGEESISYELSDQQAMIFFSQPPGLDVSLEEIEAMHIRRCLAEAARRGFTHRHAGKLLGISPKTLSSKRKKYGIEV
ncbi:MAG TPA: helix-turn-helix domain-containing protein [Rhodothermales bacterium]|nr:helix-turn-helix domain-containing protein [Rhodothermales bacterium]